MKTTKLKKGDTVTVIGRRWFERTNGNTYHSTEVYINGEQIGREPFNYGYGSSYEQTAVDILNTAGYDSLEWPISRYCRDNGVNLVSTVTDVQRKKDL